MVLSIGCLSGCEAAFVGDAPGEPGIIGPSQTADGGVSTEETPWELTRFTCDEQQTPSELPLRRLTRRQYVNALTEVLARSGLPGADRTAVLASLQDELASFPSDRVVGLETERHGGFTRLDQALQQGHVDATYAAALKAGRELLSTTARRQAVLGACATDTNTSNDTTCLRDFVSRFGRLVHRRPLSTADVAFYMPDAGSPVSAEVAGDVVASLLTAPRFLYLVEEGEPTASAPSALDAWALASRLSFLFWQTMPDEALFAAAQDGSLLTDAVYRREVDRLFADPRTDASLNDFFAEWWRLAELPPLNTLVGGAIYDAFAGEDRPTASLHTEMNAEVLDLARHVARSGGPVDALLSSRLFFARSETLARLYGQPRWNGIDPPAQFSQPVRHGLLTRAAFLASGSANTRPVMKGFRIRNALLCQTVPPPPPSAMATPLELSSELTTRETVEQLTEQEGTSCRGCHRASLNPLGFITERFDALGRARSAQRLFNDDGTVRLEKPIDASGAPNVAGSSTVIDSSEQLQALMLQGEFQSCLARQYFRYAFQRVEDEGRDGCALRSLQDEALSGAPLAQVLKAAALRPEMKRRDFR